MRRIQLACAETCLSRFAYNCWAAYLLCVFFHCTYAGNTVTFLCNAQELAVRSVAVEEAKRDEVILRLMNLLLVSTFLF